MPAYFITATGTDIGKTFVTAGLIRAARAAGHSVSAFKPVMSGYDPSQMHASDGGQLLQAMHQPVTAEAIAAIAPWRFAAPLSPDLAAQREHRTIDFGAVVSFCHAALANADTVLVEGVGGAMVPLDDTHTVRDWIAALGLPAVLVAGTYLGSISHTLTSFEALATRGIRIAHIVLSESLCAPIPPDAMAVSLRRFLPATPIHIIPRGGGGSAFRAVLGVNNS